MAFEMQTQMVLETFRKCHIQALLIDPTAPLDLRVDMGLRSLFGVTDDRRTFHDIVPSLEARTIYKLTDTFQCGYIFLRLPEEPQETVLLIGPFLKEEISRKHLLEHTEKLGLDPRHIRQLEYYYNNIPVLEESSHLFALLEAFGECLWGTDVPFNLIDLNQDKLGTSLPLPLDAGAPIPENTVWNMQIMESRYAYENELMQAVTLGQYHKAERMLQAFSATLFESRLTDPLRNLKNYFIIMNTLLRKAAEQGGVHPLYLDRMSSSFARKIELLTTTTTASELMRDMFRSYCRLVNKHAMKSYSPPVQKAITCIDSDLTADLSLRTLAAMQNLSSGYLSSLFRQETGQTLTDFVNQKRMRLAMQLLSTTNLQIQTIAQHCGILDVHYFTKMFKKYAHMTPREYRETQRT